MAVWGYVEHHTRQARMPVGHVEPAYGERRLAAAVLLLALADLRGWSSVHRSEALRWIRSGNRGALTFDFCCQVLDYNPDRMRELLLRRTGENRHRTGTKDLGFPLQRSWGLGQPRNF